MPWTGRQYTVEQLAPLHPSRLLCRDHFGARHYSHLAVQAMKQCEMTSQAITKRRL